MVKWQEEANFTSEGITSDNLRFNWSILILALFVVFGFVGNLLVCLAISTEKRLRNVTNYFLYSLAITDALVSAVVMPISLTVEFYYGRWTLGIPACAFYCYIDVFLCSSSIVHMTCISFDRYLGVSRPFKARNKTPLVVGMKIVAVWFITLLISCPLAVLMAIDQNQIFDSQNLACQMFNPYFAIYGSSLAFVLPCLVMFIAYVKTAQILQNRTLASTDNGIRRTTVVKTKISDQTSSVRRLSATPPMHSEDAVTRRATLVHNYKPRNSMDAVDLTPDHRYSLIPKNSRKESNSNRRKSCFDENGKYKGEKRMSMCSAGRRYSTELSSERKATRVLGLVFMCFFICWTPFFAANMATSFCTIFEKPCPAPRWLDTLLLWLGYVSSTLNPVIYTAFNERFRKAFVRILTPRYKCHTRESGVNISTTEDENERYYRQAGSSLNCSYRNGHVERYLYGEATE